MTPKERAAMQQALDALNTLISHHTVCYSAISESGAVDAEYTLREALDHSGEANEMVQPTVKESLTVQEQPVSQKPMTNLVMLERWMKPVQEPVRVNVNERTNSPMNVSLPLPDYRHAYAADQAEQEPVALIEECREALAQELMAYDIDPPIHHVKQAHDKCVAWLSNNAAPVQQVTRADLKAAFKEGFERAADREKNK